MTEIERITYTVTHEWQSAQCDATTRLVRYGCPVKRCKSTQWAVVSDRTDTVVRRSWQSPPPKRFPNRVYCHDRSHGVRKMPQMVEIEALSLDSAGEWVATAPRAEDDES